MNSLPDVEPCAVEGCDRDAEVRGWCLSHYNRVLKYGDPLPDKPLPPQHVVRPKPPKVGSSGVPDDLTPGQIEAARINPGRRNDG